MRDLLSEVREKHTAELKALADERRAIVEAQREERERMRDAQDERRKRENEARQQKFRGGVVGLWDVVTGRAAQLRRENETAAFASYRRDVEQRERLFEAQMQERRDVTERLDQRREQQQRGERMRTSGQVSFLLGLQRMDQAPIRENKGSKYRGLEFD